MNFRVNIFFFLVLYLLGLEHIFMQKCFLFWYIYISYSWFWDLKEELNQLWEFYGNVNWDFYALLRKNVQKNILLEFFSRIPMNPCRVSLKNTFSDMMKSISKRKYQVNFLEFLDNYIVRLIGLVGRVFANGPEDLGSIFGRVILKTFKMVLDTSLLNTHQYKVRIKGKVEQSWEMSSAFPYTSV